MVPTAIPKGSGPTLYRLSREQENSVLRCALTNNYQLLGFFFFNLSYLLGTNAQQDGEVFSPNGPLALL